VATNEPRGPKPQVTNTGKPKLGRRVRRARDRRALGTALAVVVFAAIVWFAFVRDSGPSYTVHARFASAGQLVTGGRVEVAGQPIGSIQKISITDDGRADVEMSIDDDRFVPLRSGTRASIRAVGQATLTNRYIDIGPGSGDGAEIADGGHLADDQVNGIVDLDAIFSSIDKPFRKQLQGLIARGSQIYAGSGAREFNAMLEALDPALKQVGGLMADLASDKDSLKKLIATGATSAKAVGSRNRELESAVARTATAFGAIADERAALADTLNRAPGVLKQAGGTLQRAATTANELRPTLRAVPASQPGLRTLLRRIPKTFDRVEPAMNRLAPLLKPVDTALASLPPLEKPASEGARDLGKGLDEAMPILEGVRFYGSDLLLGVVKGLASVATGGYNANGHYVKLEFVQNVQTALGGALAPLVPSLTPNGILPGIINVGLNQRARCPGSNAPPAPDGSNPWYPKEGICDPAQNMSPLVNSPSAVCYTVNNCAGQPAAPKPDVPPTLRQRNGWTK